MSFTQSMTRDLCITQRRTEATVRPLNQSRVGYELRAPCPPSRRRGSAPPPIRTGPVTTGSVASSKRGEESPTRSCRKHGLKPPSACFKASSMLELLLCLPPTTTTAWSASVSIGISIGLSPKAQTIASDLICSCDTMPALLCGLMMYPSETMPAPITGMNSDMPSLFR